MSLVRFAIADFRFRSTVAVAGMTAAILGVVTMGAAGGQVVSGLAVIATIPVGAGPAGVAVDPRSNTVLVANSRNYGDESVAVLDGSRLAVMGRILDVGSDVNSDAVVFDSRTRRFFVSAKGGEALIVVEPQSRTIVTSIPSPLGAGGFLAGMAPHPGTGMLYAVDWSGYIYGFDSKSLALQATIALPPNAREGLISVHPGGDRLYMTYGDGFLVIGTASRQIEARIPVPVSSILAVDAGRKRLYGADGRNTLYVIDGISYRVVATVRVGNGGGVLGRGLAFHPSTGHVVVANPEDGTVSVVDGGSGAIVATLPVGKWPNRIAADPNSNRVYVTNRDDGTLSVVEDR